MTPIELIGPASPFGESRETFRRSGTDGSNPVPSSEESVANLTSLIRVPKMCRPGCDSTSIASGQRLRPGSGFSIVLCQQQEFLVAALPFPSMAVGKQRNPRNLPPAAVTRRPYLQ
jgi:hypothetical protein